MIVRAKAFICNSRQKRMMAGDLGIIWSTILTWSLPSLALIFVPFEIVPILYVLCKDTTRSECAVSGRRGGVYEQLV